MIRIIENFSCELFIQLNLNGHFLFKPLSFIITISKKININPATNSILN